LVFTLILTRILNPSDYGVNDYVMTVASGVGTVALFGLPQALMTHFNDRPDDQEWRRRMTGSALALVVAISLSLGLGLVLLAAPIARWSWHDTGYATLFRVTGATLVFGAANSVMISGAQSALRVRWGMI